MKGAALEHDELYVGDEPAYSPDGVDLTQIRWMLSLAPAQRLDAVQDCANFVLETRARNGKA